MLLDFPYAYKLDGNKLYCTANTLEHGVCGAEIDYDDGFNFLRCTKCGTRYRVKQLAKDIGNNKIIVKGSKSKMEFNVVIDRGNGITETKENIGVEFNTPTDKVQAKSPTIDRGELVVSTSYVPVQKKKNNNNKTNNNNGFRSSNKDNNNRTDNRGIVRSSNNDLKVSVVASPVVKNNNEDEKEFKKVIENAEYHEYDAECDIMIFKSEDTTISVDLTSIPNDVMENFIALSGIGSELEDAKSDLLKIEEKCSEVLKENTLLKEKIDELESDHETEDESCSSLEERVNELIKELENANKEITELKEQLALAESDNKDNESAELDKANYKIRELESILDITNKSIDELVIEKNILIDDKKKLINDVEDAKKDKVSIQNHLEGILLELENENEILKSAIGIKPLLDNAVDKYTLSYDFKGLACINGIVMKISDLLNDISPENDHYVIVFINNENGYMGDVDGNVVAVTTINGRTIDDIMNFPKNIIISNETGKVIDVENAVDSEVKEAPVGAVQQ